MATQELISQLLGKKTVSALSETSGAESNQVTKLVTAALPILLAGMQNNAGTDEGAQSLAKALDQHAADDTADVAKAVKNADAADGKKILDHVLGDNTKDITKGLSKQTGLTSKQVVGILSALAPVLLSLLGSKKQEEDAKESDLGGLLGSLLFGKQSSSNSGLDLGSIASALLGGASDSKKDDDDSLLGSLVGGLLGGSDSDKKDDSLAGGLLGSLLGSSSSSGKKDADDGVGDALGSLLGSLLK